MLLSLPPKQNPSFASLLRAPLSSLSSATTSLTPSLPASLAPSLTPASTHSLLTHPRLSSSNTLHHIAQSSYNFYRLHILPRRLHSSRSPERKIEIPHSCTSAVLSSLVTRSSTSNSSSDSNQRCATARKPSPSWTRTLLLEHRVALHIPGRFSLPMLRGAYPTLTTWNRLDGFHPSNRICRSGPSSGRLLLSRSASLALVSSRLLPSFLRWLRCVCRRAAPPPGAAAAAAAGERLVRSFVRSLALSEAGKAGSGREEEKAGQSPIGKCGGGRRPAVCRLVRRMREEEDAVDGT
ncbi:hypothetical protein Mapa_012838 [Marchantia paleacea]|nr:hypothetical protein Mapa_012838 [Marchantia paleacea]